MIIYHVIAMNGSGWLIRTTPATRMWYKPKYSRVCSESHWLVPGTFDEN